MAEPLEFPAADLARRTGDVLDAASRAPVTITKHHKPRFVVMSVHRYAALTARSEQRATVLEDMPDPDETRTRSPGRAKPSEVFARYFGETHGVDLPPPARRRYRPLFMAGEET